MSNPFHALISAAFIAMEPPHDKRRSEELPLRLDKVPRTSKSIMTHHGDVAFRPVTSDTDYVINGQERWGIARSPKIRPPKPNELSALTERIIGFHTHSFA